MAPRLHLTCLRAEICIATYEKIRRSYQDKDFTELVHRLAKTEANGVVMFVHEDNVKKVRFLKNARLFSI